MSLYGLMLGQRGVCADLADPNLAESGPNTAAFLTSSYPDPNAASLPTAKPIAGTLGLNWLYQGKKPPQPLVGQEDVTFRIERYPWPYTGYFLEHGCFAGPWIYAPWHRYDYWRYYSNDYWRRYRDYSGLGYHNAYTYPLNYVNMEMKVNENTSFNLDVSFISDYLYWP